MAQAMILGVLYTWKDVVVSPFGVPLIGITKITVTKKQNKTNEYGAGTQPVGRGHGNVEYEGSMDIFSEEFFSFVNASPTKSITDIAPFSFPINLISPNRTPVTIVLRFVEFSEAPFSSSQGDTKIIMTCPIVIGEIIGL